MPDSVITAVAVQDSASTLGSNSQIKGSAITPKRAVNTIRTAVSLSRKYLSTRNLSIWVETAHISGPEKAKASHISALSGVLCTAGAVPPMEGPADLLSHGQ